MTCTVERLRTRNWHHFCLSALCHIRLNKTVLDMVLELAVHRCEPGLEFNSTSKGLVQALPGLSTQGRPPALPICSPLILEL